MLISSYVSHLLYFPLKNKIYIVKNIMLPCPSRILLRCYQASYLKVMALNVKGNARFFKIKHNAMVKDI